MILKKLKPKYKIDQEKRNIMKEEEFKNMRKRVRELETTEEFKPKQDWKY